MQVIDGITAAKRLLPASLVRYRRHDWALIAFDDAAMVFARRNAFPPAQLAAFEYRYLVPDDPSVGFSTAEIRDAARAEVARARAQFGDIRVVQELERSVTAK
jgi:hypothetical protein